MPVRPLRFSSGSAPKPAERKSDVNSEFSKSKEMRHLFNVKLPNVKFACVDTEDNENLAEKKGVYFIFLHTFKRSTNDLIEGLLENVPYLNTKFTKPISVYIINNEDVALQQLIKSSNDWEFEEPLIRLCDPDCTMAKALGTGIVNIDNMLVNKPVMLLCEDGVVKRAVEGSLYDFIFNIAEAYMAERKSIVPDITRKEAKKIIDEKHPKKCTIL